MDKLRRLHWDSVERVVSFLVGTAGQILRLIDGLRKLR